MTAGGFKNILVPVDFSENTEVAVKHAIELSFATHTSIHLLHVLQSDNTSIFSKKRLLTEREQLPARMKLMGLLKENIEKKLPLCKVNICIQKGGIYNTILNCSKEIKPQLIIVAKKRNYNFLRTSQFFPNVLANLTRYPVLTIMRAAPESEPRIIVIPVRDFIPERKIEVALVFAKLYRTKIYILGLRNPTGCNLVNKAVLDSYRILRSRLNNQIEFTILNCNNFAKDSFSYAHQVNADMIFVNPWTETRLPGLTGKHINDLLPSASRLKIVSVEPYSYIND